MGVRKLERNVGKICRKIAFKGKKIVVDKNKVIEILGPIRDKKTWGGVGIVKGLAWTSYGGKVLMVEAVKSVGKGKI
jgi:ATP-dependent Lon protease